MTRYDPFESMERMFEQMRRSAFGGPAFDARWRASDDFGDERSPSLEAGTETDLATPGPGMAGLTPFGPIGMAGHAGNTGMRADRAGTGAGVRLESTDDSYVAVADLPGFEREDITVRLDERFLTVEAAHEESEESDEDGFASWRGTRQVREVVRIPGGAELLTDDVEATYRNGVLEVRIPTDDEADDEHVIDVE